jgi:Zn-dependent M16 (insulinase) family peptidase
MFTYLSYRDPNITKTLAAYDSAPAYLRRLELPRSEVDRAIIGAIGELDTYQLPDAKGYTSMIRYLVGNTDALRQQRRDELLATTLEDFHRFGDYLAQLVDSSRVVVLGSPDAIASANEELKAGWQITKLL